MFKWSHSFVYVVHFLGVLGGRESVDRDTFMRRISLCVWFPDRNTFIRCVSLRLVSRSRHLSWEYDVIFVLLCLCTLGPLVLWAFVPFVWDGFSLMTRIFLTFLSFLPFLPFPSAMRGAPRRHGGRLRAPRGTHLHYEPLGFLAGALSSGWLSGFQLHLFSCKFACLMRRTELAYVGVRLGRMRLDGTYFSLRFFPCVIFIA